MSTTRARVLVVLVVLLGFLTAAGPRPAAAGPALPDSLWFDGTALTVRDGRFADDHGREVVLRGYNVSGETKLAENGGLPFASVADARRSAAALRALGGGNTVRFLLSWAYARGEASYLAPTEYTSFVWAALFGWLVFGEHVSPFTLAGAVLIVGACLIAARRKPDLVAHDAEAALP